jgi:hypothetical protein
VRQEDTQHPQGWSAHGAARRRVLAVLLLGLNPWVIGVLWPELTARGFRAAGLLGALACLLPLLLGGAAQPAFGNPLRLPHWVAGALWLAIYPAALAAGIALRQDELAQQNLGPITLALLWLALCAYGAGAAQTCAPIAPELSATRATLGNEPWDAPEVERRGLQHVIVGLCIVGAAAIAVIAPALGGLAALEAAWGEAARAGGVLTAVVAAALAVATIGVFLGSGLRSDSTLDAGRADAPLRAAWFLFLALLGAVTYLVVG